MDSEWVIPNPDEPVRQGDLLIRRDPINGAILEISLVLTADCDIANLKFGRDLLCLRVISFDDYVRTIWAERRYGRMREAAVGKVFGQLKKWHSLKLGAESTLTPDGVARWTCSTKPELICDELGIPAKDRESVIENLSVLSGALSAETRHPNDSYKRLVAFIAALQKKAEEIVHKDLIKQIPGEKLQDDVFLLPELPQMSVAPAVVLLREVRGVPFARVCYRAIDANSDEHLLRVGRLRPTIKYAVSQAFGALYSRIGLPTDYELRCARALESLYLPNEEGI